jgi:hypothetical protein
MAATAMTMRSRVASIGDMAFFWRKILGVDIFSCTFFATARLPFTLFNLYESGIRISGNSETEWLGTVVLGTDYSPSLYRKFK